MSTKRDWKWAMDNGLTILHGNDLFDETLDDCYGTVKIAGLEYATSDALKSTDPTAYRCGCVGHIELLVSEGEIYQLDDGTLVSENPDEIE